MSPVGSRPELDLNEVLKAAQADGGLKRNLLKFLATDELSSPEKSDLVTSTYNIIVWALQEARKNYAQNPTRLVAVISASSATNALAVWGTAENDWIVVSEGLMETLREAADDMGDRLTAAFPELLESKLGKALAAKPPFAGGFRTTLGSFLYFSAISFFVGHEAGHHISGHDGYYVSGAHAEAGDTPEAQQTGANTTAQALEHQADQLGLTICRRVLASLLTQLWELRSYSEVEKIEYQKMLAILLSAGVMMSVVKIKPEDVEWADIPGRTHPPAVVRIISLAMQLSAVFGRSFKYLDKASRKSIRQRCLEIAVGTTIKPGSKEDIILREREHRHEPVAIRATGIRKAIHDKRLRQYYRQLKKCLKAVRPQLRPRTADTSTP